MPIEYEVTWVQEHDSNVISWEFQYTPNTVVWRMVQKVEPVDDCLNCYTATITAPEQIAGVRSRSIDLNGLRSDWSNIVYLPEFESPIVIIILLVTMLFMGKRRKYGKRT